jgi:hypothetical protein
MVQVLSITARPEKVYAPANDVELQKSSFIRKRLDFLVMVLQKGVELATDESIYFARSAPEVFQ